VPSKYGTRASAQIRRDLGTDRATPARLTGVPSRGMTLTAALATVAAAAALGAGGTGAAQAATAEALQPSIPATTNAKSPFKADRQSSEPLGLVPNQTDDPFVYPSEPVALEWSPVPGAVAYRVEVSTNPGFTDIVWKSVTDQWEVVPPVLLPDGTYWWRVTAYDAAGTQGVVSSVARFAKTWPNRVSGGVLSAAPGPDQPSAGLVRITPYMRWAAVPGAAYYETQVAPADQFASPVFRSLNFPATTITPGAAGVLPDDGYEWRVRAMDAAKNPGPWVTVSYFDKAWVAPVVTAPADGATVDSLHLRWDPVPGAESYQVQISDEEHNWSGIPLKVNATTNNTGFVPSYDEWINGPLPFGTDLHWRVRPVVKGVTGTWSESHQLRWVAPSAPGATAEPLVGSNSSTALMPHLTWSPVLGAVLYRVDIATDAQFNNIVESQIVPKSTAWVPRRPLPDNERGTGYWWRVIPGSGSARDNPHWMVAESAAPKARFEKQTVMALGNAASGTLSEPPMFTWSAVDGAAKYELQLSRDQEFDAGRTQSMVVYGLGTEWTKDQGARLPSGTWYWRVRALDGAEQGLTFSPVKSFTLNPPRPDVAAPADGASVVGSPRLSWRPINGACAYEVQMADNPSFQTAAETPRPEDGGAEIAPGAPDGTAPAVDNSVVTPQTSLVPTGATVDHTGRWYWRVRANLCGNDLGPWSPARSFSSVRPPQFNLNDTPTLVEYGRRVVVAGQLKSGGRAVRNPRLVLERRLWPSDTYRAYGIVSGNASGRFAFSVKMTRSTSWRLHWLPTAGNPEGVAPFVVRVKPRVSLTLARSKAVRRSRLVVSGSVYPRRAAKLQVRESGGWATLRTITPSKNRFRVTIRASMATGRQQLRLYVPSDPQRRMEPTGSRRRSLFVYDRFVIR
jgi:hypothetical protein